MLDTDRSILFIIVQLPSTIGPVGALEVDCNPRFLLFSFTLLIPDVNHQHGALYYYVGVEEACSYETRLARAVTGRKPFVYLDDAPHIGKLAFRTLLIGG